jgi:DNA (cytosine-5)-methyltransferase 1
LKVVDLFSGAGGFSKGFENAGYDIVLANEIEAQIANTYKRNHPETLMVNQDINEFVKDIDGNIARLLEYSNLDKNEFNKRISKIDVVIGGPPCQGFSMAGERIRKKKAFLNDPRNFLFKSYLKVIQHFEPQYFLFENVVGLLSMNNGDILEEIKKLFEDETNFKEGQYHLSVRIFNANDFGVPQARKRVIILGSKSPIDFDQLISSTLANLTGELANKFIRKTTLEDAIADLNYLEANEGEGSKLYKLEPTSEYQRELRGDSTVLYNHVAPNHSEIALDRIKQVKANQNWTHLKEKDNIKSVHSGAYGRLSWDKPTKTITTRFDTPSGGRFIHPERDRTVTPREAARIQSFPDDFVFEGNKTSVCKQIGNAVPPILSEFLGLVINGLTD